MGNHTAPCGHPQEVVSREHGCQLCQIAQRDAARAEVERLKDDSVLRGKLRQAELSASDAVARLESADRVVLELRAHIEKAEADAAAAKRALASMMDEFEDGPARIGDFGGSISNEEDAQRVNTLYSQSSAALSTTAGAALLEELERLRARVQALEKALADLCFRAERCCRLLGYDEVDTTPQLVRRCRDLLSKKKCGDCADFCAPDQCVAGHSHAEGLTSCEHFRALLTQPQAAKDCSNCGTCEQMCRGNGPCSRWSQAAQTKEEP